MGRILTGGLPPVKRQTKYAKHYAEAARLKDGHKLEIPFASVEAAKKFANAALHQASGRRPWLKVGVRENLVFLWREDA